MTATLESGDRLLAYTDGATDIPIGNEKTLGIQGLAEVLSTTDLPPDGPMRALYTALLERCVAVEPDDDITLLSCEMA